MYRLGHRLMQLPTNTQQIKSFKQNKGFSQKPHNNRFSTSENLKAIFISCAPIGLALMALDSIDPKKNNTEQKNSVSQQSVAQSRSNA